MLEWFFLGIVGAVIVGFFVLIFWGALAEEKYKKANKSAVTPSTEEFPEPESVSFFARVVDLRCDIRYKGTKMPKMIKEFVVSFAKEGGEVIRLHVPEEYYDGFEVGQEGTVTLVDGQLYRFTLKDEG